MKSKVILTIIVLSQFCCTSLWFTGNGVIHDVIKAFYLDTDVLGYLTSSVQFGFITGTLIFAVLTVADRYSPSKVFLICALLGAISNLGFVWDKTVSLLSFIMMGVGGISCIIGGYFSQKYGAKKSLLLLYLFLVVAV